MTTDDANSAKTHYFHIIFAQLNASYYMCSYRCLGIVKSNDKLRLLADINLMNDDANSYIKICCDDAN